MIELDINGLLRARSFAKSFPNKLPTLISRAVNRALISGRAQAVKEVRGEYAVKASTVKQSFSMKKASGQNPEGVLTSSDRRRTLSSYRLSPKRDTTGAKRKQPKAAVKKGSSLKPLGQFVHKGMVFSRLGKSSLPVEHKSGPAVSSLVGAKKVVGHVQDYMGDVFEKRLEHEIEYALSKEKK